MLLGNILGIDAPIVILIALIVIFGGSQLPKIAKNVGSAGREFKKAQAEAADEDRKEEAAKAAAAATAAPPQALPQATYQQQPYQAPPQQQPSYQQPAPQYQQQPYQAPAPDGAGSPQGYQPAPGLQGYQPQSVPQPAATPPADGFGAQPNPGFGAPSAPAEAPKPADDDKITLSRSELEALLDQRLGKKTPPPSDPSAN